MLKISKTAMLSLYAQIMLWSVSSNTDENKPSRIYQMKPSFAKIKNFHFTSQILLWIWNTHLQNYSENRNIQVQKNLQEGEQITVASLLAVNLHQARTRYKKTDWPTMTPVTWVLPEPVTATHW